MDLTSEYNCVSTLDANSFKTGLNKIRSEIDGTHNNTEEMYNLLMSDNFYNEVEKLSTAIKSINFNTIQCLAQGNKEKICNTFKQYEKNLTLQQLERILNVVNKYTIIMSQIAQWVFINLRDIYQYCGDDGVKITRIRQIIARISYILADQMEMKRVLKGDLEIKPPLNPLLTQSNSQLEQTIMGQQYIQDNYVSPTWMYMTYFFIIVIIIIFVVIYYKNK